MFVNQNKKPVFFKIGKKIDTHQCQFALQLKKTRRRCRGCFYLEALWPLRMHLHKQYTCSLMTTLPQGVVASVCCRNSLGKRCNHAYSVITNTISGSAFEFTPQDRDKMSQFRLGHVSHCQFFSVSVFQPALLKAIFNVDPDEVRSLIFKKEDVNVQVRF